MLKFIVITSIHGLTYAVRKFAEINGWHVILVGDRRTPTVKDHPNITFLSIDKQRKLGFKLYNSCPFDHYSRKNLGYLYAMMNGADLIADTDDDNIPYDHWGKEIKIGPCSIEVVLAPKIVNVYKLFTDELIWPRGFPLQLVLDDTHPDVVVMDGQKVGIWQGLVEGDPDVDAIYRLVIGKLVSFKKRDPIALDRGIYCPINSQNTIWLSETFPYLYLPHTVDFRFTDILRGYIAQRGIWEIDSKLAFASPSAYQIRNSHNLMSDFMDEISCYVLIDRIIELLDNTRLEGCPHSDMLRMYETLHNAGIVGCRELNSVETWLEDLEAVKGRL